MVHPAASEIVISPNVILSASALAELVKLAAAHPREFVHSENPGV